MYDEILFGLTSAISFVISIVLGIGLTKSRGAQRAMWTGSFAILCVAAGGVALNGLSFLSEPLVGPLASLIPGLIAAGLLLSWKRAIGSYYTRYIVAIFAVLLAATLIAGAPILLFVAFIHLPSGLVLFFLPIYLVFSKRVPLNGILVGVGGLLIGVGGMGLATLSAGVPLLPQDLVLALLAPIFFAMTLAFGLGLLTTPGWGKAGTGVQT